MTSVMVGGTSIPLNAPIFPDTDPKLFLSAGMSVWFMSVDFPDPETPVIPHRTPVGKFTVRLDKLFSLAPQRVRAAADFFLDIGVPMDFLPRRYCPVKIG